MIPYTAHCTKTPFSRIVVPKIWLEACYSSSNTKLVRIMAWVRRFTTNLKALKSHSSKVLTPDLCVAEVELAEVHLFAHSQQRSFSEGHHHLSRRKANQVIQLSVEPKSTIGSGSLKGRWPAHKLFSVILIEASHHTTWEGPFRQSIHPN